MASKVTEQGQVTIPKPILDQLGIGPGGEVEFRRAADGKILLEKAERSIKPSRFSALVGSAGPGLTTDEIMAMTRGE